VLLPELTPETGLAVEYRIFAGMNLHVLEPYETVDRITLREPHFMPALRGQLSEHDLAVYLDHYLHGAVSGGYGSDGALKAIY
jgi:hypothetical protein